MALAARNTWEYQPGNLTASFVILSGAVIYDGALVGIHEAKSGVTSSEGYLDTWTDGTDQLVFCGVAKITDQNSSTGTGDKLTGDGTIECGVDISGVILKNVPVTGSSAVDDVGDPVYASDDNTLTLTATSGANEIGFVTRYQSSGYADVHLFSASQNFRSESPEA